MRFLLGTTAIAAVVLSGCGNPPKPPANVAVSGRIALDGSSGLPAMTATEISCVADVLRSYVKPGDLSDYVAGRRTFAQLRTSDEARTQAGVDGCLGK